MMPYSDDKEHSPSEFYYPEEITQPSATFEGKPITPKRTNKTTTTKTAKKKLKNLYTTRKRKPQ